MFSWASWCCWYSKTRNFCINFTQESIYSEKNEENLKKVPKIGQNWTHMSNSPQLFGQNSTIWWSRHVVLIPMKLPMQKKEGFFNVLLSLGHLLGRKHTWEIGGHLLSCGHSLDPNGSDHAQKFVLSLNLASAEAIKLSQSEIHWAHHNIKAKNKSDQTALKLKSQ